MRGDIYRLRAGRQVQGHEQRGPRYAVVVQSDHMLLSTVLVAPTSTSAFPSDFRPVITIDGTPTRILVEQTAAIDPQNRLGDFAGRLDADEIRELDHALRLTFGLF